VKPLVQLAGIDVSARSLTVVVAPPGGGRERLEFSNDSAGHRQLIRRLGKQGRHARVALEASGILSHMSRTGASRLLVVDGDRLLGILSLKDLLKFFALKMELEEGK
jgi:hypothetical protein